MTIRRANVNDTEKVMALLSDVLELHARIRPDIFISGTTKYSKSELDAIFRDDNRPVYVAVDENDIVRGYAFCVLREQPFSSNMRPFTSLFIDDLCVESTQRGKGTGKALLDFVKAEAKRRGCYEVTLNVWEGNDSARDFYEKQGMKVKESMMEFIL